VLQAVVSHAWPADSQVRPAHAAAITLSPVSEWRYTPGTGLDWIDSWLVTRPASAAVVGQCYTSLKQTADGPTFHTHTHTAWWGNSHGPWPHRINKVRWWHNVLRMYIINSCQSAVTDCEALHVIGLLVLTDVRSAIPKSIAALIIGLPLSIDEKCTHIGLWQA